MPIGELSEYDFYLAKLTTDEVGEPTQDPFTAKGQLANALDEAVFNPDDPVPGENIPEEKDPRRETDGELEGIEQGNTPDTPTMDTKPKSAKNSLAEAFNSVFSMDERVEDQKPTIVSPQYDGRKKDADDENQENEIGDADTPADNTDRMWLKKEYESVKPELPPSLGGKPKTDENGLTYLEYTFTVDPEKYESNNYHPIPKGADDKQAGTETFLNKKDLEERARQAEKPKESEQIEVAEVSDKEVAEAAGLLAKDKGIEEQQAEEIVKGALSGLYEVDDESVSYFASILPMGHSVLVKLQEVVEGEQKEEEEVPSEGEKKAEDEAPEKVVLDYATYIDGTSFMCFDEVEGIDYTQIAMDAKPKSPNKRPSCKTTFAQCRAKNPLYCRWHGPKLLETDVKQAMMALLGKNGCTVSVTKDKGSKSVTTFRLTIGCVPAMKEKVEEMVHKFLTQNPGIKSTEDLKEIGEDGGDITDMEEFEMDIFLVDEPPQRQSEKREAEEPQMAKEGEKSDVTAEEDAAYMEAVERGDMETTTKMVRDAAAKVFHNTKVVDSDGKPKILYHCTDENNINSFTVPWEGPIEWSGLPGLFFANKPLHEYGKNAIRVFANIKHPMDMNAGGGDYLHGRNEKQIDTFAKQYEKAIEEAPAEFEFKSDGALVISEKGLNKLANDGYYGNLQDGVVEYAVLSPTQVKSADPATYYDDGSVVPLSKRFGGGEDIRFAIGKDEPFPYETTQSEKGSTPEPKEETTEVEGIVQDVAKHLYPDGKTEGVESVAELIEFKESELGKFAQERGIDADTLTRMKEQNKVFDLLKSATQAANEFDEAVRNGDKVEDKEGLAKKAEELKSAFDAFTESLEAVRAEMESGKK